MERSPNDLYLSARDHGWTPPGVRMGKEWEPCGITADSAKRYIGGWVKDSDVIECVGWFCPDGLAHVIVADFDSGRRVIVRQLSRSSMVTFSRWKARVAEGVSSKAEASLCGEG